MAGGVGLCSEHHPEPGRANGCAQLGMPGGDRDGDPPVVTVEVAADLAEPGVEGLDGSGEGHAFSRASIGIRYASASPLSETRIMLFGPSCCSNVKRHHVE